MNYTTIVDAWQLLGPSNGPYPGTLCIPEIEVPGNLGVKAGDEATIQVVELATHGASLFAVCPLASYSPVLPWAIWAMYREGVWCMPRKKANEAVLRHHLRRTRRQAPPAPQRLRLLQHDGVRLRGRVSPGLQKGHHQGQRRRLWRCPCSLVCCAFRAGARSCWGSVVPFVKGFLVGGEDGVGGVKRVECFLVYTFSYLGIS